MTRDAERSDVLARAARAAEGDVAAQDELIRGLYPRVSRIVHGELQHDFRKHHRWILPLFSTRDVVQDVFVDAIRGLADCSFESADALIRYLCTIVRHRLLDAVRHHEAARRDSRRHVELTTDESGAAAGVVGGDPATPALAASLAEQARTLRRVLESFPQRHKALLEMRLVDDVSFPVIATRLGYASAETARQSFLDAKAKLLVRLRAAGVRG